MVYVGKQRGYHTRTQVGGRAGGRGGEAGSCTRCATSAGGGRQPPPGPGVAASRLPLSSATTPQPTPAQVLTRLLHLWPDPAACAGGDPRPAAALCGGGRDGGAAQGRRPVRVWPRRGGGAVPGGAGHQGTVGTACWVLHAGSTLVAPPGSHPCRHSLCSGLRLRGSPGTLCCAHPRPLPPRWASPPAPCCSPASPASFSVPPAPGQSPQAPCCSPATPASGPPAPGPPLITHRPVPCTLLSSAAGARGPGHHSRRRHLCGAGRAADPPRGGHRRQVPDGARAVRRRPRGSRIA